MPRKEKIADHIQKQNLMKGNAHLCKKIDLRSEIFKKYNAVVFQNAF